MELLDGRVTLHEHDRYQIRRVPISLASAVPGRARRPVSTRFEYVEITEEGNIADPGIHPYLDCRAPNQDEIDLLRPLAAADWVRSGLERTAMRYAVQHNCYSEQKRTLSWSDYWSLASSLQ